MYQSDNKGEALDKTEDAYRLKCAKIRQDFENKYKNWVEEANQANSYLRGVHNVDLRHNYGLDDILPEDVKETDKLYPSIAYSLSILDRMVQYIRHDEGDIIVTAEGRYAYPQVDPRLADLALDLGEELTDSELIAKMLTARADLFVERYNIDTLLTEIAQTAGSQRTAFVCVDWVDDESQEEPIRVKLIKAGNYWFDDCSSTVQGCKIIGYKEELDKKEVENYYDKPVTVESNKVWVYHNYVRDYTEEGSVDAENDDVGVMFKYPGAWRYTITTDNETLYDGPIETPAGRPPICVFSWRSLPSSMIGVSVLDSTRTINNNIDRTVQYIMQAAYRGLPKTAVDVALAVDPEDLQNNEVAGFLKYDSTKAPGGSGSGFAYIQGAAVPTQLYTLLDTLKSLGAEMTGADGVQMEDASHFKLSGDAIEGIAADNEGIASRVRDACYLFKTDLIELVLRFIMTYEKRDVSLSIQTPQGPVDVTTSMAAYEFKDAEFEARFDVSVFSPKNMPKNPVRRAQYLLQVLNTVSELANTDPTLARMYIEMADLPNRTDLLGYLEQKEMALQDAGQQTEVDTESQKIRERMATDTAKSVADGMESLAKEAAAQGNFELSAQILATIPIEANKAYATVMENQMGDLPLVEQPIEQIPIEGVI